MDEAATNRRGLLRHALARAARARAGEAREPATRARMPFRTASADELAEAARDVGLESRIPALRGLARRSFRLAPGTTTTSRAVAFGGRALLPRGRAWPEWQGRPLTFLARVEHRLFFFDTATMPSGFEAIHRGAGRVVTLEHGDLVAADGPVAPRVQRGGDAAAELVIPRVWSAPVEALELNEDERRAWEVLRARLAGIQGTELTDEVPVDVVHRIFGYPDHTGGDMPRACEVCTRGEDFIGGRYEVEQPARRWKLLAQFSPDPELAGWSWPGRVYFWTDGEGELWTIRR